MMAFDTPLSLSRYATLIRFRYAAFRRAIIDVIFDYASDTCHDAMPLLIATLPLTLMASLMLPRCMPYAIYRFSLMILLLLLPLMLLIRHFFAVRHIAATLRFFDAAAILLRCCRHFAITCWRYYACCADYAAVALFVFADYIDYEIRKTKRGI